MQNQPNKEGSIIGYPNRLFLDPNHFETHFRDLPGPGRVISEPRPTLNQRAGEVSDSSFENTKSLDDEIRNITGELQNQQDGDNLDG